MTSLPPIRSWLYVPGNAARRIEKAFTVGADAVVLDLEDAVPQGQKDDARSLVAKSIDAHAGLTSPAIFVRLNPVGSGEIERDVAAVVRRGLAGVRLAKCEQAVDVSQLSSLLAKAEAAARIDVGTIRIVCNIESARGAWNALEIAAASSRVMSLGFGAIDFARDAGLRPGPDDRETLYARSRLVLASRVAEVRPPIESVYPDIADTEGLARSTRESRALGFFGRSTIHPTQVPIVNAAFTPDADELRVAREVVSAAHQAAAAGVGALRLANGDFVDLAVVRRAEDTLRLAADIAGPAS
jgi:citrate lyase subunit beta/citryl-CoA lyase